MFKIPDKLHQALTCDSCHKFLSVGPVKVYRKRQIKCGRCSRFDDDGAISRYGMFAELAQFKCVNRLDGCRQLLAFSDVPDHEEFCKSKAYICPNCPQESEGIPTFLLVKHFKETHLGCFLETPFFKINLQFPNIQIFLHESKDNLYFISCSSISVDTLRLNAIYLGEQERAEEMYQKFILHYGDGLEKIETDKRKCVSAGHDSSGGFVVKKPPVDVLNIVFELDVTEILKFELKKRIIGLPRYLLGGLEDPQSSYRIGLHSLILKRNKAEILLHCNNCSKYNYSVGSDIKLLGIGGLNFQWICYFCEKYYRWKYPHLSLITLNKLCADSIDFYPSISCIWSPWGCGIFHKGFRHEMECPRQPPQLCPQSNCSFRGKLKDIEEHFKKCHSTSHIHLGHSFNITLPAADFPQKRYFWANVGFVYVYVAKKDSRFYEISIRLLDKNINRNVGTENPKVILLDKNHDFLNLVAVGMPCIISANMIYFKCYFDSQ